MSDAPSAIGGLEECLTLLVTHMHGAAFALRIGVKSSGPLDDPQLSTTMILSTPLLRISRHLSLNLSLALMARKQAPSFAGIMLKWAKM